MWCEVMLITGFHSSLVGLYPWLISSYRAQEKAWVLVVLFSEPNDSQKCVVGVSEVV